MLVAVLQTVNSFNQQQGIFSILFCSMATLIRLEVPCFFLGEVKWVVTIPYVLDALIVGKN